jgi:hypothetical protein
LVTIRTRATVKKDRKLIVKLPAGAPTGDLDVEVTIQRHTANGVARSGKKKRAPYSEPGLLEWSRENPGHFGDEMRSDDVEGFTGRRF